MNDCPNGDIRDRLPELVNDRLAPAERALVEAHVRTCELCREELELLRSMRRSMHDVPAVAVGDIVSALPAWRAPVHRSRGGWRIAAAIALLAGGATSLVMLRDARVGGQDTMQIAAVSTDSQLAVATPLPAGTDSNAPASGMRGRQDEANAPQELAMATATVADLDEEELSALLDDIESLDAITPAEVDPVTSVIPIAPASGSTPSGAGA